MANQTTHTNGTELANGQLRYLNEDGILYLTLNRPDKANALSSQMLEGIQIGLERVLEDSQIKTVVFTGSGDRIFSGGADLAEMEQAERETKFANQYLELWRKTTQAIMNCPLPTIAFLNGACVAGGLSLALCCDVRIATPNAFLSYPRVADGHLPGRFNLTQLVQLVGPSRAKLIMLFGYRVFATEAHAWGLVDSLVGEPGYADDLNSILTAVQKSDPKLLGITKSLANHVLEDAAWNQAMTQINESK